MDIIPGGGFLQDYPYVSIAIYIFLYIVILVFMFESQVRTYLDDNWLEARCYPHVIPFAGLSTYAQGDSFVDKTVRNAHYCASSIVNRFIAAFGVPFFSAVGAMTKGTSSLRTIIDRFRSMAKVMREMFGTLVESTFKRLSNSYAAVVYLQERMKTIIKKQSAIFEILSQFFTTLPFLFYSFLYGPIPRFAYWLQSYLGALIAVIVICIVCVLGGGPFGFPVGMITCPVCIACFDSETPIRIRIHPDSMSDVSLHQIPLRDIRIGHRLSDGSRVLGTLYFTQRAYPMYQYGGVWVTGTHGVYSREYDQFRSSWNRISSLLDPVKDMTIRDCDMTCLITDTHRIALGEHFFGDFTETDDPDTLFLGQHMMNIYWNPVYRSSVNYLPYTHGLHGSTRVCVGNDRMTMTIASLYHRIVSTRDHAIHDVYGVMQVNDSTVKWYQYESPNVILSGNTLVYEQKESQWIRVKDSQFATRIYPAEDIHTVYHLATQTGTVTAPIGDSEIMLRDWFESYDLTLNRNILYIYDATLRESDLIFS